MTTGLPKKRLLLVKEPFYGIMSRMSAYPIGRIDLQVTLKEGENTRSEFLTFEVVDFNSAYNCILRRPFLKKFMAVTHFAYSVLKVPGPHGPMTIHGDCKGTIACDMQTLDMVRQYAQVPVDPKEPPAKQQKTTTVVATPATPKSKEMPKDPESSKAAVARAKALHHQLRNRQPLPVKIMTKMMSWQKLMILLLNQRRPRMMRQQRKSN
jgi:hypothetical protein